MSFARCLSHVLVILVLPVALAHVSCKGEVETTDSPTLNADTGLGQLADGASSGAPPGCSGRSCVGFGHAGDPSFPLDPEQDDRLRQADGVSRDPGGGLMLTSDHTTLHYMWIANTYDMHGDQGCDGGGPGCLGSISKVDTESMKEVARYYTFTCRSEPGTSGCRDVNGLPLDPANINTPSRTAVDFNMDVWVANRSLHDGYPSVTKIASDRADCIDRNGNGTIDTSSDLDGDGRITIDCDGDGQPDDLATACSDNKQLEFLGEDDECILFTTRYGERGDIGRSVCLDAGKSNVGASNAWVGTYARSYSDRGPNLYVKVNGTTGKIEKTITLPEEHYAYGCIADGHNLVWSTDRGTDDRRGSVVYFETIHPHRVGKLLRGPDPANNYKDHKGEYHHYGITVSAAQHIWLSGWHCSWVLRYRPDRTSFDTLHQGDWTRIDLPTTMKPRGIAADDRDRIWVGIHQGYILRLDQQIPDGVHDRTTVKEGTDYWPTAAQTVIGVGVDFSGHVWAIGNSNDTASRLDVDDTGEVISPPSGQKNVVTIGKNPYTYSDFTGFGLVNFVRPQGRWSYLHGPCPGDTPPTWESVHWTATTPPGTGVSLRVRSGDSPDTLGTWSPALDTSPASLASSSTVSPNPARYLEVEFTLSSASGTHTPVLHGYNVSFACPIL